MNPMIMSMKGSVVSRLTNFRDTRQEYPASDDERVSDTAEIHHGNMIAVNFMFLFNFCVILTLSFGCGMDGVAVYQTEGGMNEKT